jgi:hypothetical protein
LWLFLLDAGCFSFSGPSRTLRERFAQAVPKSGRHLGTVRGLFRRDEASPKLSQCAGCADFSGREMVVDAAQIEPVSNGQIPCTLGNNREIGGKRANFMKTGAHSCSNFSALGDEFPKMSIREFLRASREGAGNDFR